jgi:hypothetical protein
VTPPRSYSARVADVVSPLVSTTCVPMRMRIRPGWRYVEDPPSAFFLSLLEQRTCAVRPERSGRGGVYRHVPVDQVGGVLGGFWDLGE